MVFALWFAWHVGEPQINAFLNEHRYQLEFLILFVLCSVFVFSFVTYQLFQRQTQIDNLIDDFNLLGISKDQDEIEERYNRSYNITTYILFVIIAVFTTIFGVSLFFWAPQTSALISADTLQAMRYGFVGAYLFASSLVYRRYRDSDLQPTVYLYCALVLFAGLAFNYVVFQMISQIAGAVDVTQITGASGPSNGAEAGILAIVAFALGYFPYLAVRWIQQIPVPILSLTQRRSDALPLSLIDGISDLHEARLRDEGIDNIQNLNSAPLADLLINTRFSAQQVIEWIDQAALYSYLERSEIESFRRSAVRTLSDFLDAWEDYYLAWDRSSTQPILSSQKITETDLDPLKTLREQRATQFQTTAERLDLLYKTVRLGPNVHYIRYYWAAAQSASEAFRQKSLEIHYQLTQLYYRVPTSARPYVERLLTDLTANAQTAGGGGGWGAASSQADNSYSLTNSALEAAKNGDFANAEKLYTEALNSDPYNLMALNNLAYLYADQPQFNRDPRYLQLALNLANKAIEYTWSSDIAYATHLDTLATVKIRLAQLEIDQARRKTLLDEAERHLKDAQALPIEQRTAANVQAVDQHLKEIEGLRLMVNGAQPAPTP
ncbi:MAG: hypothetical protein IAE80_01475 [Anaerolinea sp.]|nr:hypothetical protein [Anaerolinea sp.]